MDPNKPLPPLPASEHFSYGPHIEPYRIFIIVVCVLIIIAIVVVKSVFASQDKRTFKERNDYSELNVYGEQPEV